MSRGWGALLTVTALLLAGCQDVIQHSACAVGPCNVPGVDGGNNVVTGRRDAGACQNLPYPSADNTGWQPTGVTLTPYSGPEVITIPMVIDQADITSCIDVETSSFTLRRSKIHPTGTCGVILSLPSAALDGGQNSITIEDVEIDGSAADPKDHAIHGEAFTLRRSNIHHVEVGIDFSGTAGIWVEDTFIHDVNPTANPVVASPQNVTSEGASNAVFVHNNFENDNDSGDIFGLFPDFAPFGNVRIDDNILNGGGVTLYGGTKPGDPTPTDMVVQNNCFGRKFYANGGANGPVGNFDSSAPGAVWQGNRWQDTNGTVLP